MIRDLRLYSNPASDNPYFDFVKKEDCDFAIRQAYAKTVRKEDIDNQSHYFIKAKVDGVFEVFDSIVWQSVENKKKLGGTRIPCLDKYTILQFYLDNKGK